MTDAVGAVRAAYWKRWAVRLTPVDSQGVRRDGRSDGRERLRHQAIAEALRWGEPCILAGADELMCWALPLMINARVTGGLVAEVPATRLAGTGHRTHLDARSACTDLLALGTRHDVTNAALLENRRQNARQEAARAEAIRTVKRLDRTSLHDAWVREEPTLIAAIRRGDERQARHILNRVLVVVYAAAGTDRRLLKSFVMELVVTMARSAVEAGAPAHRAAVGLAHLAELVTIDDDEQLQRWVARCLNDLLEAIAAGRRDADGPLLAQAMRIIADRCAEPLGRDQVARLCHLSPAHFSRRFRARFGVPFTQALNRARSDKAAQLLATTDLGLGAIAQDCGFNDQSYFTKVFRRHLGCTPRVWRRQRQASG